MLCSNALHEHMVALQLTVLALYSFSCVSCNAVVANRLRVFLQIVQLRS